MMRQNTFIHKALSCLWSVLLRTLSFLPKHNTYCMSNISSTITCSYIFMLIAKTQNIIQELVQKLSNLLDIIFPKWSIDRTSELQQIEWVYSRTSHVMVCNHYPEVYNCEH